MLLDIRKFRPHEMEHFLAIRREALVTSPQAFATTVQQFDAMDRSVWQVRFDNHLTQSGSALAGAFLDQCVGMAGLIEPDANPVSGRRKIWGVFVRPDLQGQRVGRRLLELLMECARNSDQAEEVVLSVRKDNLPAIELYRRVGFKNFHPPQSDPLWSSPCRNELHMRIMVKS